MRKRIGIVFGTRPDAIKMAPVVLELGNRPDEFEAVVISTGQHRQMLDQVLEVFDVTTDIELDLMRHNQTLNGLTRRILEAMDTLLAETPLDCLLVQGDTTTAFAAALAAFYRKVPVAHVEAGFERGRCQARLRPRPTGLASRSKPASQRFGRFTPEGLDLRRG